MDRDFVYIIYLSLCFYNYLWVYFLVRRAPGRECASGQVVKGVGHLGHDEAMEAGGREFDPRPGHYSRISF